MRTRITKKVDIQTVINSIEYKVRLYTICIKDVMQSEGIGYADAKSYISNRTITNLIFK